jgi:GAF domain-containing protein
MTSSSDRVLDGLMEMLAGADLGDGELGSRLDEAVAGAQKLLDADGAGLMLLAESGEFTVVGASTPPAAALERVQTALGEGPGIDSTRHRRIVSVSDLRRDPRWPTLAGYAIEHGLGAVLSAPIWLHQRPAGNLNLLCLQAREWSQAEAQALAAYGGVVTAFLRIALEGRDGGSVADVLDLRRGGA